MKKRFLALATLPLILSSLPAFSATPIDLSHQSSAMLFATSREANAMEMKEINRNVDFNQTLHIRMQQTYQGYPVFGGDFIIHTPHGNQAAPAARAVTPATFMNGIVYKNLAADLANTPAYALNDAQASRAIEEATRAYQQKVNDRPVISNQESKLLVYVDEQKKAHFAFQVSFHAAPIKAKAVPAKPVYIIDAVTFKVYAQWDNIHTLDDVQGGGFGGNKKMGKLVYDGLAGHLATLSMERDAQNKLCYLENHDVIIKKCDQFNENTGCTASSNFTTACVSTDATHNGVYWDGDKDAVNGGYSPSNDALFAGAVIKDMYKKWYGLEVLTKNGQPMTLTMIVHANMENAFWDDEKSEMVFGDGGSMLYPLTSLGVGAHEISHGFTAQHSNLVYKGQSGGMNESFSDMAAQAGEFFAYNKNTWQIGPEIFKADGQALRYMDKPSKDCYWWQLPGVGCSIDNANQYSDYNPLLDVHYSSGVYNRFFYLLSTSSGWDTKKAFSVMVHANMNYWTSTSTYQTAACGVMHATKDYGYDAATPTKAFKTVGIDVNKC